MRRLIPWTLATASLLTPLGEQAWGGDGPARPAPEQVLAGNLRLLETGTGELLGGLEANDVSVLAVIYPDVVLTPDRLVPRQAIAQEDLCLFRHEQNSRLLTFGTSRDRCAWLAYAPYSTDQEIVRQFHAAERSGFWR